MIGGVLLFFRYDDQRIFVPYSVYHDWLILFDFFSTLIYGCLPFLLYYYLQIFFPFYLFHDWQRFLTFFLHHDWRLFAFFSIMIGDFLPFFLLHVCNFSIMIGRFVVTFSLP